METGTYFEKGDVRLQGMEKPLLSLEAISEVLEVNFYDFEPLVRGHIEFAQEQARAEVAREIFKEIEKALLMDEEIAQAAQMEWNASHLRVAEAQHQKILGLLNNFVKKVGRKCQYD